MPRTPRAVDTGATSGSTASALFASISECSRQPSCVLTQSPSFRSGEFEATTWPTAPPSMTAPTSNGGT